MRDPKRIARIAKKLAKVWAKAPDERLGQLLTNLCRELGQPGYPGQIDVFNVEDDNLEAFLDNHMVPKKTMKEVRAAAAELVGPFNTAIDNWLQARNVYLEQSPIALCQTKTGCAEVLAFLKRATTKRRRRR